MYIFVLYVTCIMLQSFQGFPLYGGPDQKVVNVTVGTSTHLRCGSFGWPKPITISWEFKDKVIGQVCQLKGTLLRNYN